MTQKAHKNNLAAIKKLERLEERQLHEISFSSDKTNLQSIPSVNIGLDKTLYFANDGVKGGTDRGVARHSEIFTYHNNSAESKCWTAGVGRADSFSLVGIRFSASGTKSDMAYIRFYGSYSGDLLGGPEGEATAEVKIKLWDATESSWIDTQTVMTETSVNNFSKSPSGNISHSILAKIEPGHEYFPYIHVVTTVDMLGVFAAKSNFYDEGDSHMIQFNRIKVDF